MDPEQKRSHTAFVVLNRAELDALKGHVRPSESFSAMMRRLLKKYLVTPPTLPKKRPQKQRKAPH